MRADHGGRPDRARPVRDDAAARRDVVGGREDSPIRSHACPMIRRPLLLLLLFSSPGQAQAQTAADRTPRSEAQPPGSEVMYACPGGTDFTASFSTDGELATLSVPGQPDIELSREPAGSGFGYGDSYYQLRGRGREATLTAAGRSMRCHAVGRPGEPARTYTGGGLTITLLPDGTFRLRSSKAGGEPTLDLGQWSQEVDGGARLVLRGAGAPRVYREAAGDRLVGQDGVELARAAAVDPIDGQYRMTGLYRDTQNGGVFSECQTGRAYQVAPRGAEPDLERAWTEATPSKVAQLYVEIVGHFVDGDIEPDRFVSLNRDGACPPPASRGAALQDTDWRVIEIDDERPNFDNWRDRPTLRLDDDGKYAASTGCNAIAGDYKLDPEGLRFLPSATTLKACGGQQDDIERSFLRALAAVRQARIAGTTLDLTDEAGKRRLRLDARGR
ncbi:MAG: META domain-containing protein [Alphaproteobacteria bacterium]|nr:META domain-containing protein [Alphaproteobacteria bacterium]